MASRRSVLLLLGLLGLLPPWARGRAMAMLFFGTDDKRGPRTAPDRFTDDGNSLVGVAPGNPDEAVARAVELIGGWERLTLGGKTALVKPNVVSGEPAPATTDPGVVAAVVRALYSAGCSKVVVGDMSAMLTLSTHRNLRRTGITQAAREAGAEVVAFEDHGWIEVPLSGTKYVDRAYVTEWVYRVDRIVNVPVIKTHRSASYTICLKNFIGCTHLKQRPYLVDRGHWEELVAEFNVACRPDLNVVDGTTIMIEGGPWEGTPAQTGLVIASGDRVAADALGVGLLKGFGRWDPVTSKPVWSQRQLHRARALGLGNPPDRIRVRTADGDIDFQERVAAARREAGL